MESAEEMQWEPQASLHKVKLEEEWPATASTDSETGLPMPMPMSIKSEPVISSVYSLASAEDKVEVLNVKTEIKSEMTLEEYVPSDHAGWLVDPLASHDIPKEEIRVVTIGGSEVLPKEETDDDSVDDSDDDERNVEAGFNACHEDGLQETRGDESEDESSCGKSTGHVKGCYPCTTCGKTFTFKTNLTKHEILHTGERPYVCRLCGKSYSRSDHLKKHLRIHNTSGATGEGEDKKKGGECPKCGKKLSNIDSLRIHMERHKEERPFSCDQCHKTFKLRQDLLVHLKSHADVKPHVCDVCQQRFSRRQILEKHLLKHTGQTPYNCPHCPKIFRSKWGLTCHLKNCTEAQPYARVRKGRKSYSCPHCQKEYKSKGGFTYHTKQRLCIDPP
ncbi:zinc finger protein interacting with ribonucleoprotein K-like isoform X1 [Engraulis encrasicolus]|uniref:zinc finger protein interacting with ribonucleoprotein K-like isoform X1 n=1 Tax=Engraulis encrasicolus TaxID=184585 RepID=UPI002FD4E110